MMVLESFVIGIQLQPTSRLPAIGLCRLMTVGVGATMQRAKLPSTSPHPIPTSNEKAKKLKSSSR